MYTVIFENAGITMFGNKCICVAGMKTTENKNWFPPYLDFSEVRNIINPRNLLKKTYVINRKTSCLTHKCQTLYKDVKT